ncbi:MAG: CRISPR-associated protein [Cyanobacteria bacterium SID2]|nr:CRISPR-associated protein [Cyanobacteria bacterium SID2]MBP0003126.1 CRISPR-associated protein [Cyanobacteria bacterium SBC]
MFRYLITIRPLGFLYGSAGGFLSPENLVGRSQSKFPPDAYTLSGLIFSANKSQEFASQEDLRHNLFVAGAFWAKLCEFQASQEFYVPIPSTKMIGKEGVNTWELHEDGWQQSNPDSEMTPAFKWQKISAWNQDAHTLLQQQAVAKEPWRYVSMLHPRLKSNERCVLDKDGLFLENAVQLDDNACLVYLSTFPLEAGWYRFGGENHLVEIESHELKETHPIIALLQQQIDRSFALLTPAVWGSNRISYRYPQHPDFPKPRWLLMAKAIPFRFRAGGRNKEDGSRETGRLGRGRYAVKPGSVYVFDEPLNRTWWDSPEPWYPKEGYSLKHVGCGFCLPIDVAGL